jgi:hypothetical protein
MAVTVVDIVEQLRGRMKFYHVGDPVRKDLGQICDELVEWRSGLRTFGTDSGVRGALTAGEVGSWLDGEGIKLLPWQRKRLGLAPTRMDPEEQRTPENVQ